MRSSLVKFDFTHTKQAKNWSTQNDSSQGVGILHAELRKKKMDGTPASEPASVPEILYKLSHSVKDQNISC